MEYQNEFELISSRYILDQNEMTHNEKELWLKALSDEGFDVDEKTKFFSILGELDDDNEGFSTDELRIRYWRWKNHTLTDINYWPGDNEMGIIAIDGVPFLSNVDHDLNFNNFTPHNDEFKHRLSFFAKVRPHLFEDYHDHLDENKDIEVINFLRSEDGQNSITIAENSRELYGRNMEKISDDLRKKIFR